MKEYIFSVITAVYNVEDFVAEAIESIIAQDIGFEKHIQLILVDDGAKDNSGKICDEYAAKYPENIFVYHKENGGVSSARNLGLLHAKGKYLNFMDADDKLSADTMSSVISFFDKFGDTTDIAAIRMNFFEGQTGGHILNYKFNNGDRLIDLEIEPLNPLLSSSSSFISAKAAKQMHFCENLAFTEDALEINKILLNKKKLGVISKPVYWYRRRNSGEESASRSSIQNKRYYHECLQNFSLTLLSEAKKICKTVPLFIQNLIMYDLQWRLQLKDFPTGMFSDAEIQEYFSLFKTVLLDIDDDIILSQKNISPEHKSFALQLKHNLPITMLSASINKHPLAIGSAILMDAENEKLDIIFIDITKDTLHIEGRALTLLPESENYTLFACVNGSFVECTLSEKSESIDILSKQAARWNKFFVDINLNFVSESLSISFVRMVKGKIIKQNSVKLGKFCPISESVTGSYYVKHGFVLTIHKKVLEIEKTNSTLTKKCESKLFKALLKSKRIGTTKAAITRKIVHFLSHFKHKPIILCFDRTHKADDNGEALFCYLQKNHKRDVKSFFVLSKDSVDYKRLKKIGPVLNYMGFWHKVMLLLCDVVASSAGEDTVFNPFYDRNIFYRDLLVKSSTVFLQHGITMNNLSDWLKRSKKNLQGFVTAAIPECNSIVNTEDYEYKEKNIWLTGFPRYDRLYKGTQKWITIAPTWRRNLVQPNDGNWRIKADFSDSEYYKFFQNLLTDKKLHEVAKRLGYTIAFMPHPSIFSSLDVFNIPSNVKICDFNTSYRDMYANSSLLLTDYSSVFFDMCYLEKPVMYAQFDHETFFEGQVYDRGYFDYEKNGFGEVEYTLESTVERLIEYMENGCIMKEKYAERVNKFFAFHDKNNCQRVYERIINLIAEKD